MRAAWSSVPAFNINRARFAREGVYDDDLYGDCAPLGLGSDRTLGLVNFAVRPHQKSTDYPNLTLDRVVATATGPPWVLDDRSAAMVDGDNVRVAWAGRTHYVPYRLRRHDRAAWLR